MIAIDVKYSNFSRSVEGIKKKWDVVSLTLLLPPSSREVDGVRALARKKKKDGAEYDARAAGG